MGYGILDHNARVKLRNKGERLMAPRPADPDEVDETYEEIEEEEVAPRRNPLRLIILILFVLLLLCLACVAASRLLNISIPGIGGPPPAPPVTEDTPTPIPTDEVPTDDLTPTPGTAEPTIQPTDQLPGEPTDEATQEPGVEPTDQLPGEPTDEATQEPGVEPTDQLPGEPTDEATQEPGVEPTDQLPGEPTDEATQEPGEGTPTVVPVPGPTATPGPTGQPTVMAGCENNSPPTADAGGPYNGMMGKGQAFVTLNGSGSTDSDGSIVSYEWDLGDGNMRTGQSVTYGYSGTGSYTVTLTVTDNCGATAQDTADVTVVGPTPPASDEDNSSGSTGNVSPGNAEMVAEKMAKTFLLGQVVTIPPWSY
jgi:hypothetical protein